MADYVNENENFQDSDDGERAQDDYDDEKFDAENSGSDDDLDNYNKYNLKGN